MAFVLRHNQGISHSGSPDKWGSVGKNVFLEYDSSHLQPSRAELKN